MISIATAKKRARLFKESEEAQGRKIKLNHALNHVAETFGLKNWAALKKEIESDSEPDPRDRMIFDPSSPLSQIYMDQAPYEFLSRMNTSEPINFEAWPKKLREMGWDVAVYKTSLSVYEPICFIMDSQGNEVPVFLARFNWEIGHKNDETANLFFHNIVELTKGRGDDALVLYRFPERMEIGDKSDLNTFIYSGRYHRGDTWTEVFLNNGMDDIKSILDQVDNPLDFDDPDSSLTDRNCEFYSDFLKLSQNGPVGYVHEERPATDDDFDLIFGLYVLPVEDDEYLNVGNIVNYHRIDWHAILKGLRTTFFESDHSVRLRIPNNAFDAFNLPNSNSVFTDASVIRGNVQDIITESELVDDDIIIMDKRWPPCHMHGSSNDQKATPPQCIPVVVEGSDFNIHNWYSQAIDVLGSSIDSEDQISEGKLPSQLGGVLQKAIGVEYEDNAWFVPISVGRE